MADEEAMRVEYFTLAMQVGIIFVLSFTVTLMFRNDKNAKRTMQVITETMTIQATTFNQMIRRLHDVEQKLRELEDVRTPPRQ
jgi:uncharacterized membrane protein YhaH (DUF805 family)